MSKRVLDNIRSINSYSLWVGFTHKQAIDSHVDYMLKGGDVWITYKNDNYYLCAYRTIRYSLKEKLPKSCNQYLFDRMEKEKVHISNKPWRMIYN